MDINFYELFEQFCEILNPNYCDEITDEPYDESISRFMKICGDYFDQINSNV
jgi:hypothetical protein